LKIISGGQTGVDQAALDAAIKLAIPHGGWVPKGRKTEAGPLPAMYQLKELNSDRYRDRTEKNIVDSDGTLIISFGPLTGGSALTESLALKHDRPCLVLDIELVPLDEVIEAIEKWLNKHAIETLNIAGPRASGEPRIYDVVYDMLLKLNWPKTTRK
jgi:hypothetical protein